jgi:hypothetical protein
MYINVNYLYLIVKVGFVIDLLPACLLYMRYCSLVCVGTSVLVNVKDLTSQNCF